jgi:hypothetical protein
VSKEADVAALYLPETYERKPSENQEGLSTSPTRNRLLVARCRPSVGSFEAKGFLQSQSLDELEALDLDEFRVFQVGLSELESRCGIRFADALKAADSVDERLARRPEALRVRKALESRADIDWS